MGTRHSYVPSKDASVHTRRALRAALESLVEDADSASLEALSVRTRAHAALEALDAQSSMGKVPLPYVARERLERLVTVATRVETLIMCAYAAETGNPDHT